VIHSLSVTDPTSTTFSYIFSRFILLGCPTFPLEKKQTKKNSSSPEGCAVAVHATFVQIENPLDPKKNKKKNKKKQKKKKKKGIFLKRLNKMNQAN
jgi:hypothetical protein